MKYNELPLEQLKKLTKHELKDQGFTKGQVDDYIGNADRQACFEVLGYDCEEEATDEVSEEHKKLLGIS